MSKIFLPESKVSGETRLTPPNEDVILLKESVHHYDMKTGEEIMDMVSSIPAAYFDGVLNPPEIPHIPEDEFSDIIGEDHKI